MRTHRSKSTPHDAHWQGLRTHRVPHLGQPVEEPLAACSLPSIRGQAAPGGPIPAVRARRDVGPTAPKRGKPTSPTASGLFRTSAGRSSRSRPGIPCSRSPSAQDEATAFGP
jgi:hypothetical protein